jgi:hypothetical protein
MAELKTMVNKTDDEKFLNQVNNENNLERNP